MPKGFALITVTIITAVLLVLGGYFISFSVTDLHIARAHAATTRAYYVAEAATAFFIHEIKNNNSYRTRFENGSLSKTNSEISLENIFEDSDGLTAYATSTAPGEATIYSVSETPLGTTAAARATATDIVRALGSALADYSIFGGATTDAEFKEMDIVVNGGIVFSNDDIDVEDGAHITVNNGHVWARDEVRVEAGSTLVINNGTLRENKPKLEMPAMDFSSNQPGSWKNQANVVMQSREFNQLADNTTLEGIIFVVGTPEDLKKRLTVRGLLIINGNFEIEAPGFLQIIANGGPSGLLVKNTLEIESDVAIEGLVYGGNDVEIEYDNNETEGTLDVNINGGIMGRRIEISRDKQGPSNITITHNPALISLILNEENNPGLESPTIDVGHWEEEY